MSSIHNLRVYRRVYRPRPARSLPDTVQRGPVLDSPTLRGALAFISIYGLLAFWLWCAW